MTIIIGAELSDGRKVITGDGNVVVKGGGVKARSFVKVHVVNATFNKRKALVGISGAPMHTAPMTSAINAYMMAPKPQIEDLHGRLVRAFENYTDKDAHAVIWLPVVHPDGSETHELIGITDDLAVRQCERRFEACGSGGTEARAALLGLEYRDRHTAATFHWKPSEDDLQTAYRVACDLDIYCGGEQSLVVL